MNACVIHRVIRLMTTLVLVSLSLGCHVVLYDLDYTKKEPNRFDLVGTWVLDPSTAKEMRTKGGYDPSVETKLVLRDDGTFYLSNMPDWWGNGEGKSHAGFDQYVGNWKTTQGANGLWDLMLYSKVMRPLSLLGQKAPYRLFSYIGDPDNDQLMIFIKQQLRSGTLAPRKVTGPHDSTYGLPSRLHTRLQRAS